MSIVLTSRRDELKDKGRVGTMLGWEIVLIPKIVYLGFYNYHLDCNENQHCQTSLNLWIVEGYLTHRH
jgi:hypothetical protein